MSSGSVIKRTVKRTLRNPITGRLAVRAADLVGAPYLGRRISLIGGARVPELVTGPLPDELFHNHAVSMVTAEGRDQVACSLWSHGWDRYECPLPAFYAATVRSGDVVLDVGSNTGYYALLAASVAPDVEVHAFEPLPPVYRLLTTNLTCNPQGARVRPVAAAVDSVSGVAELYIPQARHNLIETSASLDDNFRTEWSGSVSVDRVTLDEYTSPLPQVNVLKIDVECLEQRVLEGARETLRRHRPVIFLEVLDCDDCHTYYAAIDSIRREASYLSIRLHPRAAVLADRVCYDEPWRNQALWPSERVDVLREVTRRLGYGIW